MIDFMRASAAQGAGEYDTAAKSYEAVINSGHVSGAAQSKIVQALGDMYYRSGEYPKAIVWMTRYQSETGDASERPYLVDAYFRSGKFAEAAKEISADIQAEEKTGRSPSEQQLSTLVSCENKLGDKAGYLAALEKYAAYHPTKEIWNSLLSKLQNKSGFNNARLGLDVLRLQMQLGVLSTSADYMNYVELAIQANFPSEAKKAMDAAYKSGAFGVGAEASRQKRLQDLVTKSVDDDSKAIAKAEADALKSKNGEALITVGYDYVTLGQYDKGIPLIEQGIAAGDLKHPDDAKLHLGIAYALAGKKAKALQALKAVQGTDGTVELAHYWTLAINHPLN
jgi:tetratricopeptide (TPR) repeat protein